MFIGLFFLVLGVSLLVEKILGIDIPVFRSFFAVFLIYLGVKILFGGYGIKAHKVASSHQAIFSQSAFSHEQGNKNEYETVMGKSTLDLSKQDVTNMLEPIKVTTVMGDTKIILPKNSAYKITASSVLGNVSLPNDTKNALGNMLYESDLFRTNGKGLEIKIDVVMGNLKVSEI